MPLTRLSSKKDYIRVMFYWKTQAILVYLLIVASIMLFAYTYTPVYESTARILVLPRTSEGIVISSGTDEKKLTPVAIEDTIAAHPDIRSVAVVGFPDERLGERICAVLQVAGEAIGKDALVAFCQSNGLAKHLLPEKVFHISDMPMTPAGNIRKNDVRAWLSAQTSSTETAG